MLIPVGRIAEGSNKLALMFNLSSFARRDNGVHFSGYLQEERDELRP